MVGMYDILLYLTALGGKDKEGIHTLFGKGAQTCIFNLSYDSLNFSLLSFNRLETTHKSGSQMPICVWLKFLCRCFSTLQFEIKVIVSVKTRLVL